MSLTELGLGLPTAVRLPAAEPTVATERHALPSSRLKRSPDLMPHGPACGPPGSGRSPPRKPLVAKQARGLRHSTITGPPIRSPAGRILAAGDTREHGGDRAGGGAAGRRCGRTASGIPICSTALVLPAHRRRALMQGNPDPALGARRAVGRDLRAAGSIRAASAPRLTSGTMLILTLLLSRRAAPVAARDGAPGPWFAGHSSLPVLAAARPALELTNFAVRSTCPILDEPPSRRALLASGWRGSEQRPQASGAFGFGYDGAARAASRVSNTRHACAHD